MSLLFRNRALGDTNNQLIPARSFGGSGGANVTPKTALAHSAVWACQMLRANLISAMDLDVYRKVGDLQVSAESTPFLDDPAGDGFGVQDWLFSSQVDLDGSGNAFGVIAARDALGYPAQVELVDSSTVTVKGKGPKITSYKFGGQEYDPRDIWHERQWTLPGIPLGLSPIAKAAMSIGQYFSAQQFAADWFATGGIPSGSLKNVERTIDPAEARIAKDRFKDAVANRDIFVHGADWEYDMESVKADESQFLATMQYGIVDIARFFSVPADLIDAEVKNTTKVTYANITQRNLQFLVLNLNGPIVRRESTLSRRALPRGRFVKFDTNGFLRMDPQNMQSMLVGMVEGRVLAPSEARAMSNRQPFTPAQIAEFALLNPPPALAVGDTP